VDFSRKESWTVELLEKTLEYHTVLSPDERGNFNKLWRAKEQCEANMGIRIRPPKEVLEQMEKEALTYAKTTLEIEGRSLTPDGEELIRRRFRGEISHDEFLRLARELAERE